jgi:hypothetical protein
LALSFYSFGFHKFGTVAGVPSRDCAWLISILVEVCSAADAVDVINPSGLRVSDGIVHRPPPMQTSLAKAERTRFKFLVWLDGSLTAAAQQIFGNKDVLWRLWFIGWFGFMYSIGFTPEYGQSGSRVVFAVCPRSRPRRKVQQTLTQLGFVLDVR